MGDFKRLDALLKKFADETVPGCACVVMKKEEVLHEGYAGWADAEQKRPIDPKSVFRQASTTKLFTYAIMGMLYEEGRFLFSDPIGEYLPEWKHTTKWIRKENGEVEVLPLERPITVRGAAAMMCGLPYCMFPEPAPKDLTVKCMSEKMKELLAKGTPTLREEVRQMAEVPVRFEPGTHWLYGFGSEIIGALVEELTGNGTSYVRPPFGIWGPELEEELDMIPVLWTIDTLDWTTQNVDWIVEKTVQDAGENDIILMHDSYESTVQAAERIIRRLKAEGFEFVTVDQVIMD